MKLETKYDMDQQVYFIHHNRMQRGTIKYVDASKGRVKGMVLYGVEFMDTTEQGKVSEVHINEDQVFDKTGDLFTFLERDYNDFLTGKRF